MVPGLFGLRRLTGNPTETLWWGTGCMPLNMTPPDPLMTVVIPIIKVQCKITEATQPKLLMKIPIQRVSVQMSYTAEAGEHGERASPYTLKHFYPMQCHDRNIAKVTGWPLEQTIQHTLGRCRA